MFRIPNNSERTAVLGMTGSGKTQGGAFLLSRQRFETIPWIILDFKREEMFDDMRPFPLPNWEPPRDPGIYIAYCDPSENEDVESLLWKIHARGNCGIFVDEGMVLGHSKAFRVVLTQGRSLGIPMIVCTQRPKLVSLSVFTESNFFMIYHLTHPEDEKLVAGYVGRRRYLEPLPKYHFYWYEVTERTLIKMRPVPDRSLIANGIAQRQEMLASRQKSRVYL